MQVGFMYWVVDIIGHHTTVPFTFPLQLFQNKLKAVISFFIHQVLFFRKYSSQP